MLKYLRILSLSLQISNHVSAQSAPIISPEWDITTQVSMVQRFMLIAPSIQSYMCIGFPDSKYNEPLQLAAELQFSVTEILEIHIVFCKSSAIIKFLKAFFLENSVLMYG